MSERLRERRTEIEQAMLTRVYAVSDPAEVNDPAYLAGLREAVTAGLEYGLSALESTMAPGSVPVQLLHQARNAATADVPLDTVLRRYVAGFTVIGDYIMAVASEEGPIEGSELQAMLRAESLVFDRLLTTVTVEYNRESQARSGAEGGHAERVRSLLAGKSLEADDLGYELRGWHIGVVVTEPRAKATLSDLARALDRRLLVVKVGEDLIWAWLGGNRKVATSEVLGFAESSWPAEATLALGEPGEGIEGWRLTHWQAKAALAVARNRSEQRVAYADVALVAAMLQDHVLAASLPRIYLDPLRVGRDGGATLCRTLRAYFAAERNASSAAADLGVSRKTVANRLRLIEKRLERPLASCSAELEAALQLDIVTSELQRKGAYGSSRSEGSTENSWAAGESTPHRPGASRRTAIQ